MVAVQKIDSNVTGLRYQEETSIGVPNVANDWKNLEPNSYDNFGGEFSTIARNPINAGRQRKKGILSDLDAAGGFGSDLTQSNLEDILQGFFFASLRPKGEEVPTQATITTDLFDAASTTGFFVGSLIFVTGFVEAANNGFHTVTAIVVDTTVEVLGSSLVTETPPAGANMVVVGQVGAAGDIDVDATGTLPTLTSTILDFTTLGIIPGEWIFVGGDLAANKFVDANNNGFARVNAIAANVLTFDKTSGLMVTEASTTETIQLFFGRALKNEADPTLQVRRSYQLERSLGAPDDATPANIQAEYLEGAVANELTFNFATADKVTMDLGFVAIDTSTIDGATALKAGTRPSLASEDAFNTSNDISRLKLSVLDRAAGSNPVALFAFLTEFSVTVSNNINPNKAIGTLGAFDVSAGQFEVGGSMEAYFADVTAISSIRNNDDVTLDFAMVKGSAGAKSGVLVDVPLITLGDGRLDVEQDEPITLPLDTEAGADEVFDHTLLMMFYDFLPDAADV